MFSILARLVQRHSWFVLLAWALVTYILFQYAPLWEQITRDDDVRFFPRDYPSVIGQELLERGFPQDAASSQVVLIHERADGPLTPADLAVVEDRVAKFHEFSQRDPELGVKKIDTHRTPVIGPRLIGKASDGPGQAVLSIVSLRGTYLARKTRIAVDKILEYLDGTPPLPQGLRRVVSGSAVVGHDINSAANASIDSTTKTTIALVVIILLLVYRSPLLAMIPLLTIALSVVASMKVIALLTVVPGLSFQVITITKVFLVVVLFGAGTDYCLFLIARYREELARGNSRPEALREAITQVGGALMASAGTVIVGLGMLYFSSFAKIRYTGPAIAISLTVALIAALTLAPILLSWLRGAIFWPFRAPRHEQGKNIEEEARGRSWLSGFWFRVADLVVTYPLTILALCLAGLVPLAVVGARTTANYSQLADLDPDRPSVVGASVIRRYFAVGELSPTSAFVHNTRLDFRSEEGRAAVREVTRRLVAIPAVAEVRSLTQPLGRPPVPEAEMSLVQRMADQALRAVADSRYVSVRPADRADVNHIARFDIVFKSDPFSPASLDGLEEVREALVSSSRSGQPLHGTAAIGLAGSTSAVNDLKTVTTADQQRMYVLVTLGVYAILVALLRRPGICLYLIFTVVLGYLASLGVTELVFRALHHSTEPWGGLDWTVGFFLFVILVAVGEDYNILLMARVIEEEEKHGVTEGTRLAVAHTGGIISSCGLIMAGTFGSMLTGTLTSLRELGFALGLGILLDTFLVRPILVPAFVVVMERLRAERPMGRAAALPAALDQRSPQSRFQPAGVAPKGEGRLHPDAIDSCLGEIYED
ncbi:Membrane transport protein mmpL8 [Aquisphaera giovannonii]|uniref:Membrane transport protein mmpL8 n=1 Tax=Aquisphaera giovannonii TaxID=406548 RepID=A0A5B9VYM3_9BACT|nr:MMPL family transporter [Aquisphaera giovannonii]QEH33097.1 Membrane transport protein mmpL8 [Aquisphaera giovannonii]